MAEESVESKPVRTIDEINNEYRNLCATIGDREVKITFLKAEINRLQVRCMEIDKEAGTLPKQVAPTVVGEANGNSAGPQ